MTAWNNLRQTLPEIAARADRLRDVLGSTASRQDEAFYLDRGTSIRAASIMAESGATRGVYGVGAWVIGTRVAPAIFVSPGLAPAGGGPASEAQVRFLVDADEGRRQLLNGVYAVALPPAQEYARGAGTGLSATAGMRRLTVGAAGTRQGVTGVFTAGHAVPTVGAVVRNRDGDRIGQVTASISRATCATIGPTADIGFIETNSRTVLDRWAPTVVAAAKARDSVVMVTSRGLLPSTVRGVSPDWILDANSPSWGEVLLTVEDLAQEGDSGAAVLSVEGALVGHVVGGSGRDFTVIQDAEYQMNAIQAQVL